MKHLLLTHVEKINARLADHCLSQNNTFVFLKFRACNINSEFTDCLVH